MTYNIGSAILIVGCIFLDYQYHFSWWTVPLIALGIVSWAYVGFSDERKGLYKAQIELYKAKAEYYRERLRA